MIPPYIPECISEMTRIVRESNERAVKSKKGGRFPPHPLFQCFEENDLHIPVHQCAEKKKEGEDHYVLKGLFW